MPIGHDERRYAAEDAEAEREEMRQRMVKEQAAKPVPFSRDEARRRLRDHAGEAQEHKRLHPNDVMMNDALLAVQLAQQKVNDLIELRVACRRQAREMN